MAASDNEKIKGIYGNYNLWSWLKYWYLDSYNLVMLMLVDKGYYDYDYKMPESKKVTEATPMSKDKLQKTMEKFGFGRKMTPENLQKVAMEQTKKTEK